MVGVRARRGTDIVLVQPGRTVRASALAPALLTALRRYPKLMDAALHGDSELSRRFRGEPRRSRYVWMLAQHHRAFKILAHRSGGPWVEVARLKGPLRSGRAGIHLLAWPDWWKGEPVAISTDYVHALEAAGAALDAASAPEQDWAAERGLVNDALELLAAALLSPRAGARRREIEARLARRDRYQDLMDHAYQGGAPGLGKRS